MKNRIVFFSSLICLAVAMAGCKKDAMIDPPLADEINTLASNKALQPGLPEPLVTGLGGKVWAAPSGLAVICLCPTRSQALFCVLILRRVIIRLLPVDYPS